MPSVASQRCRQLQCSNELIVELDTNVNSNDLNIDVVDQSDGLDSMYGLESYVNSSDIGPTRRAVPATDRQRAAILRICSESSQVHCNFRSLD